jgi:eukaryotic-like serine/threonine-protein kinase
VSRQLEHAALRGADTPVPTRLSVLLMELARAPEEELRPTWIHAPAAGAVVGRYEIVQEIGRGGFGVVYEARDQDLGRSVAFKAVKPGAHRASLREERLIQEAEAAARLSHPNIVSLFDVGRSEEGPYLVFEFLHGQSLAQRLAQGPLPVAEAVRITVEVAKAVAHAHEHGVAHRDLTPGNVFLCAEGHVKVLDFGMAHAFGRRRVEGGTPGYMAPEQEVGAPEDERTDVWALGVLLYRMLADELPFDDDEPVGRAPAVEVPGAPDLGVLVARMLERDPVKRPRDASEVLAPLAAVVRDLEQAPQTGGSARTRKRRPRSARTVAAIAVAAALGAGGVWLAGRSGGGGSRPPPPSSAASIAVLPFADLSPGKDHEFFSDGLADEIRTSLAQIEGLRVPGRTSSFFFKGTNANLSDIGKELKVGAVLEGSVRTVGSRVRVSAQVVSVADGSRVWGQTYDREVSDVFAVQSDIAHSVVDALGVNVLGVARWPVDRSTRDPDVYTQYLLGRQQSHRRTREGYRLAAAAFEKALAIDPGYAPAWAGLAVPLFYSADDQLERGAHAAQRRRALAAAEKAVSLAPDLPEALSTRGSLRALIDFDWQGAMADLERALALSPNDADSRRRYGTLLADQGRLPEAIVEVRKAVDLDPLGQSWSTLGALYLAAGELAQAQDAFRRMRQILPDAPAPMMLLARALLLEGKPRDALTALERCPAEPYRLWGAAMAQQALGNPAASTAALEALASKYANTSAILVAEIHVWRGDKDAAFTWLERAADDPGSISGQLRSNPFLRGVRDDPRYRAILRKVKLAVD